MPKSSKTPKNVVAMPRPALTSRMASQPTGPSATQVAKRAFELYCERGRQDGRDLDDWLQAERELQKTASFTAA